jgi:hypothetical protein
MLIYRPSELYNKPARRGQPATRGKFPVGRTTFFEEIEPKLERVRLGPRAIGYTDRSVERVIEEGIAAARAEREQAAD